MSLQTPQYNLEDFPEVYDPREDTYLFLDALEAELPTIKNSNPTFVLEVGSGSGIAVTSLAHLFKKECAFFATDINAEACQATKNTATLNRADVEVCSMDLFKNFRGQMFDVVLFNPPYVVTETQELDGFGLNRAWAGGASGRSVIDDFLAKLPDVLSEDGVCYMVAIEENNIEDVRSVMKEVGFETDVVKERKIIGEHLFILKFYKMKVL